jgi:hypothetical protein
MSGSLQWAVETFKSTEVIVVIDGPNEATVGILHVLEDSTGLTRIRPLPSIIESGRNWPDMFCTAI